MQAASPLPKSQLLAQLEQALNATKSTSATPTQSALDRRHRRERGGADSKMDSAEEWHGPKRSSTPTPAPPAPAPAPANIAPKPALDLQACQEALRQRLEQSLRLQDEIDALDARTDLAEDYATLAHHALAQGAWQQASEALNRSRNMRRPCGSELDAWRFALAIAHMGLGNAAGATRLLQQNSAHPQDMAEAWRTMAREFEGWGMPALAAQARALGGQEAKATRATLVEALRAGESAHALAQRVDLTPQQLTAYEALLQAYPA